MNSNKTLYFAYGSNLDYEDWSKWCSEREEDPSRLIEVEPAFLPDYKLKFHYYSSGRKGGAADIVEAGKGSIVPGVLFELDEYTVALMDRKEGVKGKSYQRKKVHVITLNGSVIEALTYVVCQGSIRNKFIEPTVDYANLIRKGLEKRGLPTDFLEAAINDDPTSCKLNRIFVYGTLMNGESRHQAIKNSDLEFINSGFTRGSLMHISDYPGLIYSSKSKVLGELYTCEDITKTLDKFDQIEGFYDYQSSDSLFIRIVSKIELQGNIVLAWAYLFNGLDGKEIPSGNWRNRD